MSNMIKTKIVHYHSIPVIAYEFFVNMTSHIVINFGKILLKIIFSSNSLQLSTEFLLTETKKLVVPSDLSNIPGNSFNQVSSPYMSSFPVLEPSLPARIWANQVSWCARVEVVSDSAKLRIASKNDGMDPVVIALTRGMVTVGGLACAVKGIATPSLISLSHSSASQLPK